MNLELESMYFNSVWELVDQPDGVKPMGSKWFYKGKGVQMVRWKLLKLD